MTDRKTLDKAKALFTGATQGDKLAREVIAIAERAMQKALTAQQDARVQADSASSYTNPARQTGPYQYVVATKEKPR